MTLKYFWNNVARMYSYSFSKISLSDKWNLFKNELSGTSFNEQPVCMSSILWMETCIEDTSLNKKYCSEAGNPEKVGYICKENSLA